MANQPPQRLEPGGVGEEDGPAAAPASLPGLQVRCCQDGSEPVRRPVAGEWPSVPGKSESGTSLSGQVKGHSLPLRASPGTAGLTHDHSRGALPDGLALI